MFLLYHAYVYLEFLILACTIYILAPARAQKELAWANYLNSQLVSQQRLQGFLIESVQSGQDRTNISAFQPMGVSAYEDTISTFSKSVIESQKL